MTAREQTEEMLTALEKFLDINSHIPDDALKFSGEIVVDGYSLLKLRETHRKWHLAAEELAEKY